MPSLEPETQLILQKLESQTLFDNISSSNANDFKKKLEGEYEKYWMFFDELFKNNKIGIEVQKSTLQKLENLYKNRLLAFEKNRVSKEKTPKFNSDSDSFNFQKNVLSNKN